MTCMFELVGYKPGQKLKVLSAVKGLEEVATASITQSATGVAFILYVQTHLPCGDVQPLIAAVLAPLGISVKAIAPSNGLKP